jgi:DNA-binding HxlR family transcriptional regulator
MLTQQLRELEDAGVVERIIYPVVPPKVEYKLTASGEALIPILEELFNWGRDYAQEHNIVLHKNETCVID